MAGKGTPSQSMKVGARMQELMGDLKGAVSTISSDIKDATENIKDAKREYRDLEKRQRKGENVNLDTAAERILKEEGAKLTLQSKKRELNARIKSEKRLKADIDRRLGGFEKRTVGQLYNVKDSLTLVSKKLMETQSGIAQSVGKSLGTVSSKITPGLISGAAKVAGPVGAAYTGYKIGRKYVEAQHGFRDRAKQISEIQGASAMASLAEYRNLSTQDLSASFLKQVNETGQKAASGAKADISREDIIQADLGAMYRDYKGLATLLTASTPIGPLLAWLPDMKGASNKELRTAKRKSEREAESRMLHGVGEMYGQDFAKKFSVDELMNSKEVKGAWQKYLEEDRSVMEALGDIGGKLLGKEEFIRKYAEHVQTSTIAVEATERAQEKARAMRYPDHVAERHIRSTRWSGLERQRIREEMSYARF